MTDAEKIIASLPESERPIAKLALQVIRLRQALGYFLEDSRFQITVGGNPSAVENMLARARGVYEATK